MTSNLWRSWRAAEPPADFTERTVAAILGERVSRRAFAGRRWPLVGVIAAVLIGGAAWGLGGFSLRPRPLPAPDPPATIDPPPHAVPPIVHARPAEVTPQAPSASAPTPRRKVEAPAPDSAAARRKVVLPRCFCSPYEAICDCY